MSKEPSPAREHEGRIAVITGGARGFGKAFGHALAGRGAHVVLADIDAEAVELAAAEVRATGGSAESAVCDVADEHRVGALADSIAAAHGGIDIYINNAGLHSAEFSVPMATTGVARLRRLFDVNLMGTIIGTLAAAPYMKGRPNASVVNISSSAGYSCPTAYGVSKLAVRGVTITSAHELGADGIRVNAIAPGLILTDTIRLELPSAMIDMVQAQQVIRRDGEEADVVNAMLFLVSEQARFVTGETLRISGGFTLGIG